ncbi:MAG: NYN domain-containing protein [Candidatus Brocadiia bacterium]
MHFIVDGYNLLLSLAHGTLRHGALESARDGLLRGLSTFALKSGTHNITVVFDGRERSSEKTRYGRVDVVFSPDTGADEYIVGMLSNPLIYTVVTDDREVASSARQLGHRQMGTMSFSRMAELVPSSPQPESEEPETREEGQRRISVTAEDFGLSPDDVIELKPAEKKRKPVNKKRT